MLLYPVAQVGKVTGRLLVVIGAPEKYVNQNIEIMMQQNAYNINYYYTWIAVQIA